MDEIEQLRLDALRIEKKADSQPEYMKGTLVFTSHIKIKDSLPWITKN